MKTVKSFVFIIVCTILATTASFAQGLEISPVRFDFDLEPGANQSQTLTVRNTSNKEATYTLSTGDWYLDETGNVIRQSAGENQRSCADWVSFNPALVELEANESQEVTVTINVPDGEAQTKWSIVYITLQKEQEAPQVDQDLAMGIEVNQAVAVFITQSPKSNTNASAKLSEFKEITGDSDASRKFAVIAENTGDKIVDCKLFLVISDLENATERRSEPVEFRVLPEGTSMGELALPEDLKSGSYLVAAILDYGPNFPLEGAQMQIEVN